MTNDNQDDLWGAAPADDLLGDAQDDGPDLFGDSPAQVPADSAPDAATTTGESFSATAPVTTAKAQTDGYVVLARKYRPQTFDDLVGQDSVQQALRGAIATGQISHAYLFSGPRGTGKTSTARILAKAVNCQNGGPRPDPCGKCSSCRSITAGSSLDVIEIDAASNTGVDNIRDLKSGVVLAPFSRYKVYIVDEVHMLSNQAFNALLKTLEEPPSQVIFVLATTELHKVPETIISRCSTFLFRRFSLAELKGQLGHILDIETRNRGIDVSPDNRERILDLIARNAEGGMRDAQVTLDQVLVLSSGNLDFDSVRRFLGIADNEALDQFVTQLNSRDSKGLLQLIENLVSQGQDLELFVKSASEHMRDILLVRTAGRDTSLINVSEDRALELEAMATAISPSFLINAIELFIKLVGEMKVSGQPRIVLELAILKLTVGSGPDDIDDLRRRLTELEARVASGPVSASLERQAETRQSGRAIVQPAQPANTYSVMETPVSYKPAAEASQDSSPLQVQPAADATAASKNLTAHTGAVDPEALGHKVLARIQQQSPMLYLSLEKVYCGHEADGRTFNLYIASAPKGSSSTVMRQGHLQTISDVVAELTNGNLGARVVVRDDLSPHKPEVTSRGDAPAVPASIPADITSAPAARTSTDQAAPTAVIEPDVHAGPVIYYPQEIREKAMRELPPAEFQAMLIADARMKNLVDKMKSLFNIDDKQLKFLKSTLA